MASSSRIRSASSTVQAISSTPAFRAASTSRDVMIGWYAQTAFTPSFGAFFSRMAGKRRRIAESPARRAGPAQLYCVQSRRVFG